MWESRVLRRAFERLELHEGKLSRAVLRGGGGGDVTSLPDTWVGNHPGLPGQPVPQRPFESHSCPLEGHGSSEVGGRKLLNPKPLTLILKPSPERELKRLENRRVLEQRSHRPMELPPREVLERLGKRDTDLAAMSSQDAQRFGEWNVLGLPKKVLADIRHFPQTCQLWHADAPRLQGHELRGMPGEGINASEFRSPEALHIDAVPKERMPGQVVICVGDEDLRAVQDHRGVGLPSQVKFRASR